MYNSFWVESDDVYFKKNSGIDFKAFWKVFNKCSIKNILNINMLCWL